MRKYGFTLIELMIVVAIISIIAAIAMPNLMRSRIQSNESTTIGNLRTITSSQVSYRSTHSTYATFDELTSADPPYLNGDWSAERNGYAYDLQVDEYAWDCSAEPVIVGGGGERTFYVDQSGIIREDGPDGPPIGTDGGS
ncbi:MAG: type pilus assembly protein PilA [Candidatus Hydrogenedentes bacterium]|nr:type pilus assembly protein PilA [Candidatus Hydrogenedentota bacterium]